MSSNPTIDPTKGPLKVPAHRIYQAEDLFTRMDEELAEIIKGLNILINQLQYLLQLLTYQPKKGETRIIERTIGVSDTIKSFYTVKITVTPDEAKEVKLYGDAVVITPSDTVLVMERPDSPGIPVYSGSYLTIKRTPDLKNIYIKSGVNTTAYVYIMMADLSG